MAVTKAIRKRLDAMCADPAGTSFSDAMKIAQHYFGESRQSGSHVVFKMPWPGDPRVNLQKVGKNGAKAYQVRQLLTAVERMEQLTRKGGTDV
jgi:hypothetical protein